MMLMKREGKGVWGVRHWSVCVLVGVFVCLFALVQTPSGND